MVLILRIEIVLVTNFSLRNSKQIFDRLVSTVVLNLLIESVVVVYFSLLNIKQICDRLVSIFKSKIILLGLFFNFFLRLLGFFRNFSPRLP